MVASATSRISYDKPVVFIGGGEVNWQLFENFIERPVIAVDGGANGLVQRQIAYDWLLGDFDSVHQEILAEAKSRERAYALGDQDETDFAKALNIVDAPVIYAFGFLGGRLDHSLNVLAQISKHADRRIYLIGASDIAFIWPPKGQTEIPIASRISFWSAGSAQIAYSYGLKWPLDGMVINAAGMSVSNETIGAVEINYAGDPLIAFVDTACPLI